VPSACDAAAADDLIGHLLVLHGIHPKPVEERVSRALDGIRPALHGGDVQLAGIADGIARVELSGTGCASSAGGIELAVRETVLAAAPELRDVQQVRAAAAKTVALIPLSQVRRRPAGEPA
jgi:Fe-S cluster biogenesis protein NfuA